uniref:Uncharacterized protein n=1 Tax=Gouania willdenowi TaxID=441366 RepID=A0A8C5EKY1_GOUWI
MRKTFACDDTMIITIPIGRIQNASSGQLVPDQFHCVFKDSYKVFVEKGKPRPLGVSPPLRLLYKLCYIYLFIFQTKLSFFLNIISFFWSVVAFGLCLYRFLRKSEPIITGLNAVIMSLLVVENILTLILIYWLCTTVCKKSFNSLPTILLKRSD